MSDVESKPQPTIQTKVPIRHSKGRSSLVVATLAATIAILSLISQLFFWQMHENTKTSFSELIAPLQNLSQNLQSELRQQKLQLAQLQTQLSQAHVEKFGNEIYILEAEYLVTMAYYNLLFETNTDVAINLLETADSKLKQSANSSLIEIRKSLANNIIALKAIPKIDIPGLILRIHAVSDQIATLDQNKVKVEAKTTEVAPTKTTSWSQKIFALLQQLKGIVSIRRVNQPIEPLLTTAQQFYVLENIRFNLAQAQWAVLHRDQDLYQLGLQRANQLIQQYFSSSSQAKNIQQILSDLQAVSLKPTLPDLSKTLNMIQSTTKNTQMSNPPSSNSPVINQPASLSPNISPNTPGEKPWNTPNPIFPRAMPS